MIVWWREEVGVWVRDEDGKVLVERKRNSLVERGGGSKRYQNLDEGREDI